jgi:uncharacterized protein YbbC (DUF1343 family)
MASVKTGLEVLQAQGFAALSGLRIGAIVNPTSVDRDFRHLADLLAQSRAVKLASLFGPEHGVRGEAQYMEAVGEARDPRTGLPVYSLYGHTFESLSPRPEQLNGLDALVFDIQDVGSRYYTYVYTMLLAMRAAAKAGVRLIVLDRPNPLGGELIEGNLIGERFHSFVGLYPLPNRHGMTAGELARLFNSTEPKACELTVIACEGLKRAHFWSDTGLAFVPPSPNMPTPDTALVYPGMCLLEGTNVSEGRGTCRPFELFGAPWLDAGEVAETLNRLELPGVRFRPASFTPTFDKYKGASCSGAMIHVTDRKAFKPLLTGLAIVKVARELSDGKFQWRADAYEFVEQIPAFDLLCGTDEVRRKLEEGEPLPNLVDGFDAQAEQFRKQRAPYLLYG